MAQPLQIKPASAADHDQWLPLWQAYLSFYKTELPAAVSQSTWERFLDPGEPTHLALAWKGNEAVGMVQFIYHRSNWSIGNSCYLQDLFVSPQVRGTGAGRLLIEHVYATAKDNQCAKVHWLTHETNATAIQLYERIAERPGFIQFRKALS
ncbi:GNAT family N-acetyltransferase [Pseudomonas paraversuta]|uniref:GNAT family N-acetyltransferase n=1 Tax=Pseudomonas TaxID=286 RepID=UPI0002BF3495|nr:GNAT family N-acetyltransferase [Pseudomonas sp. Lz4W]AUB77439.1 GNAT family N-acetyltransferase [Pseudomonas sp. Lz4W]